MMGEKEKKEQEELKRLRKENAKKNDNIMLIETARRLAVGAFVENLDVVITTAGQTEQVDKSLPIKQSKQDWIQKLGVTDTTGHIWAILDMSSYNPMIRGHRLIIKAAEIDEFTNKGGGQEKRLRIQKYEVSTDVGEPPSAKPKAEGVIELLVERILEKYDIAATDALWPCTKTDKKAGITKTNWIIYHRYCEQIAAKAGIVFQDPELVVNEVDDKGARTVVLLVKGQLGHVKEWSYGEASPKTTFLPYIFAIAEKRGKDRVILKLAGFHGMVYSDVEEEWSNDK